MPHVPPVDRRIEQGGGRTRLAGIDNLDALSVGNQFAEACGCLAVVSSASHGQVSGVSIDSRRKR
ncbi:hypothetical protein J4730_28455 [Klebsiella pneumoniae]|uniref:Uncharacterized protein n=1 Tax=Klebsiella pneumoniae TaxID=573 RepID=A0A939NND5_KLEPN|nr:hypothetical protein [Klebsiella pneumoniae]